MGISRIDQNMRKTRKKEILRSSLRSSYPSRLIYIDDHELVSVVGTSYKQPCCIHLKNPRQKPSFSGKKTLSTLTSHHSPSSAPKWAIYKRREKKNHSLKQPINRKPESNKSFFLSLLIPIGENVICFTDDDSAAASWMMLISAESIWWRRRSKQNKRNSQWVTECQTTPERESRRVEIFTRGKTR